MMFRRHVVPYMALRIDDRILAVLLGIGFSVVNAFVYMYLALKLGMATGLDILLLFFAFFVFAAARSATPRAFLYMVAVMAMAIAAVLAYTDSLGSIIMAGETLPVPGFVMAALISLSLILGILTSAYFTGYFMRSDFPWPGPKVSVSIIGLLSAEKKGAEFKASAVKMGVAGIIGGVVSGLRSLRIIPETLGSSVAGLSLSPFLAGIGMIVGLRGCLQIALGAVGSLLVLYVAEGGAADYIAHMRSPWIFSTAVSMMVASAGLSLLLVLKPLLASAWHRARQPLPHESARKNNQVDGAPGGRISRIAYGLILLAASGLAAVLLHYFVGVSLWLFALCIPVALILMVIETRGRAEMAMSVGIAAFVVILLVGLAFQNIVSLLLFQGFVLATTLGFASTLSLHKVASVFEIDQKNLRYMLVIGAIVGGILCVPCINLIHSMYGIGTEALPAPYSVMWLEMARSAVTKVLSPSINLYFVLVGTILALVLYRFKISAISVALGLLLPVSATAAILTGGAISWLAGKKSWLKDDSGIVASGLVAGDILVGLLFAATTLL